MAFVLKIRCVLNSPEFRKATEVKNSFMTIGSIAKRLRVNAFHYIRDRISKRINFKEINDGRISNTRF